MFSLHMPNTGNYRLDPPLLAVREGVDTMGVLTIFCERLEGSTATVNFPMTASKNIHVGTVN